MKFVITDASQYASGKKGLFDKVLVRNDTDEEQVRLELKELYIKFLVVTLLLVLLAWVVSVLSILLKSAKKGEIIIPDAMSFALMLKEFMGKD